MQSPELAIITGLSGSGKASVLKVFEDMGFYAVDNLPIDLIPTFAQLCRHSPEISRAALVVDIREGQALKRFPALFRSLREKNPVLLLFLESGDAVLQRRFSETRRPHPLGRKDTILENLRAERRLLAPIQKLADLTIDTSEFNIHDLRRLITSRFSGSAKGPLLLVTVRSFGFKYGAAKRQRPRLRRSFSTQPELRARLPSSERQTPQGRPLRSVFPTDGRVHWTHLRSFHLPHPPLRARGQEQPDDQLRLHGRPSPFGDDCRGHRAKLGGSRLHNQDRAPRRPQERLSGCPSRLFSPADDRSTR